MPHFENKNLSFTYACLKYLNILVLHVFHNKKKKELNEFYQRRNIVLPNIMPKISFQ